MVRATIFFCETVVFYKLLQGWSLTSSNASLYAEDDDDDMNMTKSYTKNECEALATHILHVSNLPTECMKFKNVVDNVQANDKDLTHPTSWMG